MRITGILHEDQYTFSIIARSVLLRVNDISDKSCRETRNTHFIFNNVFFLENRAVHEIMWKNVVEWVRPQMIWRMHIACWIPKATNAHTCRAITISSPLQQ